MRPKARIAIGLVLAAGAVSPRPGVAQGAVQPADPVTAQRTAQLRAEIQALRRKYREKQQIVADLMRQRVAWDILVDLTEDEILFGTTVSTTMDRGQLEKALSEQADRTQALRRQLASLHAGNYLEPKLVPAIPPAAPGPVAGPATPNAGEGASGPAGERAARGADEPVVGIPERYLVPRRQNEERSTLSLPLPFAMDPLALEGRAKLRVEPARNSTKRIESLLRGGILTEALFRVDEELEAKGDQAVLLYVKANILERLGRVSEAAVVYAKVVELDTAVTADDKKLPGEWAKSASLARSYLDWWSRSSTFKPPDWKAYTW